VFLGSYQCNVSCAGPNLWESLQFKDLKRPFRILGALDLRTRGVVFHGSFKCPHNLQCGRRFEIIKKRSFGWIVNPLFQGGHWGVGINAKSR
jgi:hypothetical protein